ncbi:serine/threonine-protein kinase [Methylobacterium komagatae]
MSTAAPPLLLRPGNVVAGRYALASLIGQGATGAVYRALDLRRMEPDGRSTDVALKVSAEDERLARLLRHEALCLRAARHPRLVRLRDSGTAGARAMLVLDLLHGRTLAAILRERGGRPLGLGAALRVIRDVGDALTHLHRVGLIHGDVKPGNVMIGPDGRATLIDLGAARSYRPDALVPDDPVALTCSVTPAYAAPGLLAGGSPDPRDDVFSLALLGCAMLSGRHPFGGASCLDAMAQGGGPLRPRGLDDGRWEAFSKGLAWNAAARPASVAAFVAQVEPATVVDRFRFWIGLPAARSAEPDGPGRLRFACVSP